MSKRHLWTLEKILRNRKRQEPVMHTESGEFRRGYEQGLNEGIKAGHARGLADATNSKDQEANNALIRASTIKRKTVEEIYSHGYDTGYDNGYANAKIEEGK